MCCRALLGIALEDIKDIKHSLVHQLARKAVAAQIMNRSLQDTFLLWRRWPDHTRDPFSSSCLGERRRGWSWLTGALLPGHLERGRPFLDHWSLAQRVCD